MKTVASVSSPSPQTKRGGWPRRRNPEKRTAVTNHIRLHVTGSEVRFIRGTLIDVSPSGFRVRHNSRNLQPGAIVHAWGIVGARTIWTKISGTLVESGFMLMD